RCDEPAARARRRRYPIRSRRRSRSIGPPSRGAARHAVGRARAHDQDGERGEEREGDARGRDHQAVRRVLGRQRGKIPAERLPRSLGGRAVSAPRTPGRRGATIARVGSLAAAAAALAACSEAPLDAVAKRWELLEQYCTDCHNDIEFAGNLSLSGVSAEHVAEDPEVWESVVRKLRGDLMPPPGARRPPNERLNDFVAALEGYLDALAPAPRPGRVAAHRLNRNEYAAAVRDLLGVRIDVQAMLPADLSSDGFDNIARVLGMSPTHLDRYIAAARDISRMAVGEADAPAARAEYRVERENQTAHIDGLPLGTRGGLLVRHQFPADGEYVFSLEVASVPAADLRAYPHGWLDYRHRVILTIDGEKVFEGELGGEEDLRAVDQQQISAVEAIKDRFRNIRLNVKAGEREV